MPQDGERRSDGAPSSTVTFGEPRVWLDPIVSVGPFQWIPFVLFGSQQPHRTAAPSLFCALPHSAQCHHLQRQHLQQLCITSCISSASTISITSITSPTSTHCFHHLHRLHPSPPPLTSTSPAPPPPPCAAEDPSLGSALLRWPISSCPAPIPPGGLSSGPAGAQTSRTAPSTAESSSCPRLGPHSWVHLHPPPRAPS